MSLEQIEGVITVMTTHWTTTDGRYHILIKAHAYKQARAQITTNFTAYYANHLRQSKTETDSWLFFGKPCIPDTLDNTNASSGKNSFLSTSAASFGSFDLSKTSDLFDAFQPPASNLYSWSDVVKQSPISKEVTTPTPSTTATTATSVFVYPKQGPQPHMQNTATLRQI